MEMKPAETVDSSESSYGELIQNKVRQHPDRAFLSLSSLFSAIDER